MKKQSKKFVLAGVLLLAVTGLLALTGCKNDTVPEPTRYTVKFETAHGTVPADITVESGTKLTAEQLKGLADTADYIFEGWYDGETKAEGGTYTVTKDVTLVAKWKPRDQVQISFQVSGNIVELSSEPAGAAIYYTTDGTEPKESSDEYTKPIEIASKTIIKAYAQGTGMKPSDVVEKTYLVVTFNTNGGSDVAPQVVESGTKLTAEQLKGLADTADYIFEGWYDGETKAEGDTYTVTKDVTLVAKWRERGVTAAVSFSVDENGRVALSSETRDATIHYTTDGTDPKTSETRQEGNSVSITQQTTVKAYATKEGLKESDVVEKTYLVVTFDANGGTFADGKDTKTETVESGRTATKPTDPTNGDKVLAGWYEDSGLTKKFDFSTPVTADTTLYAYWQVAPVTFSLAGDIVTLSTTEGATIHYTTDGTDPKTSETRQEGNSVSITQQTTVKAYATKKELKESDVVEKTYLVVTFDANGGTFADGKDTKTETVESGKTIEEPPVTYPGTKNELYRWKDESGAKVAFPLEVVEDMTLTAEWGIKVSDTVYPKTSEVQVLSTEVYLSSLYNADSKSQIFVENRKDSIKPFVMGQYEVTQQLYFAVMGKWGGTEPSDSCGEGDEYPAYYVSWYDAVVFCNELTKKVLGPGACVYYSDAEFTEVYTTGDVTGRKTPYMDISKSGYRLPTEAEWELAARGGNAGAGAWQYTYAGTNEESTLGDYAWYSSNSTSKTHQVGTKAANGLKLYDMSGNVLEWCWDRHGSIEAATLSGGAASGSDRVRRGGGCYSGANGCTVSRRSGYSPSSSGNDLGFRLVRSAN